jgi:hypothetical protein
VASRGAAASIGRGAESYFLAASIAFLHFASIVAVLDTDCGPLPASGRMGGWRSLSLVFSTIDITARADDITPDFGNRLGATWGAALFVAFAKGAIL